jgi:predicted transcriptional regulator
VDEQTIILTAQIISAHLAHNDVAVERLPAFIREVHQALAAIGQGSVGSTKAQPTVLLKQSDFFDHITCLGCGRSFKMLKRHISTDHHQTPDQYRIKWGLPPSYPMVAAEYAAQRSKLALASGLGRKVEAAPRPKRRRGISN